MTRIPRARLVGATLLALLTVPAVMATTPARADTSPSGVLDAQMESYAMRVEYDLPLPAGTGTVAHVNGEARRSDAGENAKGLAGAPTEMDAVVSGKYVDPQGTGTPQRKLPQSECFYPGSLVSTHFYFPTDTQAETASQPPAGYATAQCGAGPTVELHAHDQSSEVPGSPTAPAAGVVTTGSVASDALAHPVNDVLQSQTSSAASAVSILGGVIKIGSVLATGQSATNGKAGGGSSRADVKLSDITAGGQTFSLASSSDNGKEQVELSAAGQTVPVDSSAGKGVIDAVNQAIGPQGCTLTPLTTPSSYPQGFLFSRPDPTLGIKPDGSVAASMRGGLLIVCTMPHAVTDNLDGFSPERFQVLLGFAYTGVTATSSIGGFNLGDLGGATLSGVSTGGPIGGASAGLGGLATVAPDLGGATGPGAATGPTADPASAAIHQAAGAAAPVLASRNAFAVVHFHMNPKLRWLLGLLGLLGWAALTHLGATRFLLATAPCGEKA